MRVAATDVGARGGAAWQGVRTAQSLAARTWPTSFSTHVNRGLRWAVHDEKRRGGLSGSLRATLRLSWLLLESLLLFPLSKLPFAIEAWRYRNDHVQLVQLANTTLEVYAPVTAQGHCCEDIAKTVLFVHGGSWAQGAPWQYSLLAQKLIQRTEAVVVIAQYRLFPGGCVDDMVDDVADALHWCRHRPGGDPSQVVLAAQSAGAHLCALVLSRVHCTPLASEAKAEAAGIGQSSVVDAPAEDLTDSAVSADPASSSAWVPRRFLALSGVYDIAPHFCHERTRLVHWLSPMWRAMLSRRSHDGDARMRVSTLQPLPIGRATAQMLALGRKDARGMFDMSAARASGTTRTSAALSAAAMSDETGVGGADQSVRECARAEAAERDDGFAGVLLAALSGCIAAQGAEAVAAAVGADSPLLTLETHALWVRAKIRAFGAKDPRVWRQDPRVWHAASSPTRLLQLHAANAVHASAAARIVASDPEKARQVLDQIFSRCCLPPPGADLTELLLRSAAGAIVTPADVTSAISQSFERLASSPDDPALHAVDGAPEVAAQADESWSGPGDFANRERRLIWPPTVVLHARDDATVPISSSRCFVNALRAAVRAHGYPQDDEGDDVGDVLIDYREYGRAGHGEAMLKLTGAVPFDKKIADFDDLDRMVDEFLDAAAL